MGAGGRRRGPAADQRAGGGRRGRPPEILNVAILRRLAAGQPGTARITYRARRANVVAVIQVVEDLDGARRVTSQREISVVAAAFGHEEGDLRPPARVRDAGPEAA